MGTSSGHFKVNNIYLSWGLLVNTIFQFVLNYFFSNFTPKNLFDTFNEISYSIKLIFTSKRIRNKCIPLQRELGVWDSLNKGVLMQSKKQTLS